jgi:hypothetical protein
MVAHAINDGWDVALMMSWQHHADSSGTHSRTARCCIVGTAENTGRIFLEDVDRRADSLNSMPHYGIGGRRPQPTRHAPYGSCPWWSCRVPKLLLVAC